MIMQNQLITEVDNPITRITRPISSKTLRKYFLSLMPHVEKAIANNLPFLWEYHYVAFFVS